MKFGTSLYIRTSLILVLMNTLILVVASTFSSLSAQSDETLVNKLANYFASQLLYVASYTLILFIYLQNILYTTES